MKTSLIIIALALVACFVSLVCLVWRVSRPDEPVTPRVSDTSRGPSFEVHVERPRMDRFLGGILPTKLEAKLLGGELRFDHASRGAKIGSVGKDRLALSADGWDLLIETDGEGGIAPGTRLVFPIEIAEKQPKRNPGLELANAFSVRIRFSINPFGLARSQIKFSCLCKT
jgi:hypothetical protein